jgi:sulfatase modifying factor 1
MNRFVTFLILLLSLTLSSALRANASSQWMWHGAFPWVYSHAESSWWYMKAGTDGKFLAWKQGDEKWYSFDEASQAWVVLPGQEDAQEDQQVPTENRAGDTYTVQGASDLEMIWVEPGTFTMGQSDIFEASPIHQVTLTQGFYLGKYEVTQTQYEAVIGFNPTPSIFAGDNLPVQPVSYDDIQLFLQRLNKAELLNLPAGWAYVLPTEAEWEYACRAGTTTIYSWGDTITGSRANYENPFYHDSIYNANLRDFEVGKYTPNQWGFYDMHGSVSEWTADRYGTYSSEALTDPEGAASGFLGVTRGGPSARRGRIWQSSRNTGQGFRLGLKKGQ